MSKIESKTQKKRLRPRSTRESINHRDSNRVESNLDHLSCLNIDTKPASIRLTGIICTIGPASRKVDVLMRMLDAGMNIARLNFSHGSQEYHAATIAAIREAVKKHNREHNNPLLTVGIALDTKGPEIRTGVVAAGGGSGEIELQRGKKIKVTIDDKYKESGTNEIIYVDYANIIKVISPGNRIYLDDGLISLIVQEVHSNHLLCLVDNAGKLGSKKGVNLPGIAVDLPALSAKDKKDILFGVDQEVDMIFASFIRNAAAVNEIRSLLGEKGKHIKIVSKIENHEGVKQIDEIIEASDAIMVARGDLGIEIPPEKVFVAQKMMISKCNIAGKPIICATQMLESMVSHPRPTRAETSDVANAVLDGADCVMLSGETAKGDYPVETVKMMHSIALEAEAAMQTTSVFNELCLRIAPPAHPAQAISIGAVSAALKLKAIAIIVATNNDHELIAHEISRFKPRCPIISVVRNAQVARQEHLYRAILPFLSYAQQKSDDSMQDLESRVKGVIAFGQSRNILRKGDHILIVTESAHNYMMRIQAVP